MPKYTPMTIVGDGSRIIAVEEGDYKKKIYEFWSEIAAVDRKWSLKPD